MLYSGFDFYVKNKVYYHDMISSPPFTVKELREAIPPHCFERSFFRSSLYLLRNLVIAILLGFFAINYGEMYPVIWPIYWIFQGMALTGLWIVAHECGHGSFSRYQTINDIIGFALHTSLLIPYFSWKFSHHSHHSHCGSLEEEMVYVPEVTKEPQKSSKVYSASI
ncbi:DUF3474 domain-containing protein [Chlamydiales bacterium]|nr:DUF3474 domain-containing protein [Chlamydiales bacterium]